MSRKHFEAAAKLIRNLREQAHNLRQSNPELAMRLDHQAYGATEVFIAVAMDANPRFERARFEAACAF
jgi:hypothetical protein